jgi:hypothetical protein
LARRAPRISIIGSGQCGPEIEELAQRLGRILAEKDCDVVCGGLAGVMRAVCKGAAEKGGRTIGIVPGSDPSEANEYVQTAVATGLGQMRNFLVVLNGDVVLAVEGGAGTLSELGHALKMGKPVVALGRWADLPGVRPAGSPEEAAQIALEIANDQAGVF